jgi:mannose-6-phosphate isomerase class I
VTLRNRGSHRDASRNAAFGANDIVILPDPASRERDPSFPAYNPMPRYEPLGGSVRVGWAGPAATIPRLARVLAVDGPAILDWDAVSRGIEAAVRERGRDVHLVPVRPYMAPWPAILERTMSPELPDDPDFATLASGTLADLFEAIPDPVTRSEELTVVFGPGAALVNHQVLWYADLPKRFAEVAVKDGKAHNLGQPADSLPGTTKRLFYIDWPLLDRHRQSISGDIDCWIDMQDSTRPASIEGDVLRRTAADLARKPFRTLPTFNVASWGGHWAQRVLGMNPTARNTALGYELIAPESGVLFGHDEERQVEIPFELIVAQCPADVLGDAVREEFGSSFPVRFDYLDTLDGGNLSIHCHPQTDYMQRVFGWPYTQHESYYIMVGRANKSIFLGLRDDINLETFERLAHDAEVDGQPFEIERHVQQLPGTPHQLFMIPAGTPHGSGEGNVVLEISATPYLYSLRFYDWLRQDEDGSSRPVHVNHAFANLNRRSGRSVTSELVQTPHTVATGPDWCEEVIGALPEVFFEVRRIVLNGDWPAEGETGDRFHVLNVVEGAGAVIETESGNSHVIAYAETLLLPAAIGRYRVRRLGSERVRVVKALVRSTHAQMVSQ